jgi:ornithine cyclodeaminase
MTTGAPAHQPVVTGGHRPAGFAVVTAPQVQNALRGREHQVVRLVEDTYRLHCAGDTVNPPSQFLRFPDRPSSRIIALPASIAGPARVDGLKWISSFPENVAAGLPRASAVLILNDHDTGYPFACLEASVISATRTAALAASAADRLRRGGRRPRRIGFVGTGLIARYVHTVLVGTGWSFDEIGVHDVSSDSADGFRGYLDRSGTNARVAVHGTAERLVRTSDLVVFATVAGRPHVSDPSWFTRSQVVLHLSLRDLAPDVVVAAANVVDDVEHSFQADTSLQLAEQAVGNRGFLAGTLGEVMAGRQSLPADRPVVFSPFGLGVLDLAVGKFVYDRLAGTGELRVVEDFFHQLNRFA